MNSQSSTHAHAQHLPPLSGPVTNTPPQQHQRNPSADNVLLPPLRPPSLSGTPPVAVQHKRSYQACIPCRRRKVRCDLGSVEVPHSPPCVRCRRESKECFFSATRRRGPGEVVGAAAADGGAANGSEESGSDVPRKKRPRSDATGDKKRRESDVYPAILPTILPTKPPSASTETNPIRPSIAGNINYLTRPQSQKDSLPTFTNTNTDGETNADPGRNPSYTSNTSRADYEDPVQAASNSAKTLLQTEIYDTPSALALLFEAVGRSSHIISTTGNSGYRSASNSATSAGVRRASSRKNSSSSLTGASPPVNGTMNPPPARSTVSSSESGSKGGDAGSPGSPKVNRNHINNLSIHSVKNRRKSGRELSPSRSRVLMTEETVKPKSILGSAFDKVNGDADIDPTLLALPNQKEMMDIDNDLTRLRSVSENPSTTSSIREDKVEDPFADYPPEDIASSLRAWSKYRFVISGWFSPREALLYILYFYKHMAPMSPMFTGYYANPAKHEELIASEPVLSTTLLTLASRYCLLPGPGGLSRSYAIHDKLWTNLQNMFQRLMWGSEKRMRTMGTVVALAALTEWHCRGLHFPGEGDGEAIASVGTLGSAPYGDFRSGDALGAQSEMGEDGGNGSKNVVEGLNDSIGNLLEPAYRSDRMSWMLLGNALALAYELGVFDESEDAQHKPDENPFMSGPVQGNPNATSFQAQASGKLVSKPSTQTVQKILVISVMHLASRLGWTSMIPRNISHTVLFRGSQPSPLQHATKLDGEDPHPQPDANEPSLTASPIQDQVLHSWVELTSLMKSASELLFSSRSATRKALRNGRYIGLLEHFQPLLRNWKTDFDGLLIEEPMRSIMTVEYEYLRLYVNSLALQAIVERCTSTNFNPSSTGLLHPSSAGRDKNSSGNHIDLDSNPTITSNTFSAPPPIMASNPGFAALMQIYSGDVEYIKEVVDASRCLLVTVVRKLLPGGWLKHAPVRTYLRIASAAMYLLKTFALGAKEDDIRVSLTLMDQTVHALRAASCDDVHLALRFADLLETLTARIRTRFVRMSRSGAETPVRNAHDDDKDEQIPTSAADNRFDSLPNGQFGAFQSQLNGSNNTPMFPNGYNSSQLPFQNFQPQQISMNFNNMNNNNNDNSNNNMMATQPTQPQQFQSYHTFPTSFHSLENFNNHMATNYGDDINAGDWDLGIGRGSNGDDWLALPIDPLFASYGVGVTQTPMGPDVGGMDLLELLLLDDAGGVGGGSSSSGNNGGNGLN